MNKGHKKVNIFYEIVIGIVIGVLSTCMSVYYASNVYYDSEDVGYDNTVSAIVSDNVQDAIDELCTTASNKIIDRVYPVGSIFMSINLANTTDVSNALGGTWETYGAGRILVGIDGNSQISAGTTGGYETLSYTPSGTNTNMSIVMNSQTLNHTGGGVTGTALTEAQLPVVSGSITMHNAATATPVNDVSGHFTSGHTNSNSYTLQSSKGYTGYTSIGRINLSFGSGTTHTHAFTRPSAHTFTPTATCTNPTFTGISANIGAVQPYVTVYMYRRVS